MHMTYKITTRLIHVHCKHIGFIKVNQSWSADWHSLPSWKSSWIFMKVHEIWRKNAPIIHEISWRFMKLHEFSWRWLMLIFMNKIIHEKCVILTSGIFMKVHEDSPLWLKVTECAWTSRLGGYVDNQLLWLTLMNQKMFTVYMYVYIINWNTKY